MPHHHFFHVPLTWSCRLSVYDLWRIGVSLLVMLLCFAYPSLAWQGKVVAVSHADTLAIARDDKVEKIKLYGIECPDKEQPFAEKAKILTTYLTLKKYVEVTPIMKNPDGTTCALVKVNRERDYVNKQLVGYGMAWVYSKSCSTRLCQDWKKLEDLARRNKIGLWYDRNPVPPWEWRKQQMHKILKRGSS